MTARLQLFAVVAAILIAAGGGIYLKGRMDAAASAALDTLRATERQRAERDRTDAEIRKLDHAGLCQRLGGVWRNGTCH